MIVIGLLLFAAFVTEVAGQDPDFVVRPKNTAARRGDPARLECQVKDLGNDRVEWKMGDTRIYDSGDGVADSKFDVQPDVDNGHYDLMVLAVTDDLADEYTCRFLIDGKKSTAQLVSVGNVKCSDAGKEVDEGDNMELRCEVEFVGYKNPMLDWFDEEGAEYSGDVQAGDGISILSINQTADAAFDELMFFCNVSFEAIDSEEDAPDYEDSCHTHFIINHPPTNIEFSPEPDSDGALEDVESGGYINCSASGRPQVTYIWYDENDAEVITDPGLPITLDMVGNQNIYKCVASNMFNGEPRQTEKTVRFTAVEASTSGCSMTSSQLFLLLLTFLAAIARS